MDEDIQPVIGEQPSIELSRTEDIQPEIGEQPISAEPTADASGDSEREGGDAAADPQDTQGESEVVAGIRGEGADALGSSIDTPSVSEELATHSAGISALFSQSSPPDVPEEHLHHGRLFLLSGGFFQLAIMVPEKPRPSLSETEVAEICTTWTHRKRKAILPFYKAMRTVFKDARKHDFREVAHESCGICMETFEEGDTLASLPCASRGCGSVWHLSCIHKWLNQGKTPSCPLCRAQVDCGKAAETAAPPAPSYAIIGGGLGGPGGAQPRTATSESGFSEVFMGVLFQHLLSQQLGSSQDSPLSRMAGLAGLASQVSMAARLEEAGAPAP